MSTRKKRWHKYRAQLPILSRFILSLTINRLYSIRNDFGSRYIVKDGYEIGAQNSPLKCKNANNILYIDYLSKEESSQKYHIPINECVDVNIIADANDLNVIPANSTSFIIANHVLEHCPNPIGALLCWLRILKTQGVLFLTLPNYKSNEFDFEKIPANIAHLIADYKKAMNKEDISTEHIFEHIQLIDGIDPDNVPAFEKRYKSIVESNLHTHYHVFNRKNVVDLLHYIHQQTPIQIVNTFSFENSFELLFIIEKNGFESQKSMTIKQNKLFNFAIMFKHIPIFLFHKILSKLQSR